MRNLFVVAYIWGFGGHLNPRYWPRYDAFAREALYQSCYRVEVPAGGLIFHHFINFNEGPQWEASTGICSTGKRSLHLSYPIIPQYEKHAFLLDLMLEARQPALVIGEKGSGKTTLCRSLLSRERPHRRLPASPCLTTADLRGILENLGCQKTKLDNMPVGVQKVGCLLFVDDLHSAPCDDFGTSMALETLRLSMSRGGVLTSNGLRFKLFRSGAFSYLATCSTPGKDHLSYGSITPRLSRLFSIFTLPDLSEDVLFSIHHPRLQPWLKEVQITPHLKNVSACIISATLDLYHLVQEKFPRSMERPYLMFSPCDLQKVFLGMCLWGPQRSTRQPTSSIHTSISQSSFYLHPFTMATHGPLADLLTIVRLWMHECLRTFGDRLCSEQEKKLLMSLIVQVSEVTFGEREPSQHPAGKLGTEPSTVCSAPVTEKTHLKKSPRASGKYRNTQGEEWISSSSEIEHEDTHGNSKDFPFKETNFSSRVSCFLSKEELQSEKFSKSFENDNVSQGIKEEMTKDMKLKNLGLQPNFGPMSDDMSDPSVLWPSPPKQTKPLDKSDWKRSFKLVGQCPQKSVLNPVTVTTQNPALCLVPLDLLRGMEITVQDAVFSPELSEQVHSSAQQNFKYNTAYLERDPGILDQQLRRIMKLRVETELTEPGISCHGYAMFGQRLHQLAHVLRALLIPGGHGALFAAAKGTGRRTNVRLAAQLTGCRLLEVHAGNEAMLHQLLKEAATRSGLHGSNVVLLVHDDVSQPIRDEILLAMANGSFPDLHSNKELKNMIKKINAKIMNSCNQLREEEGLAKFFHQVEQNMHVFLIMPLESKMLEQTRKLLWRSIARALELCCCVEVYQPWSTQSLIEVAAHHLKQNIQASDLGVQVDSATWLSSVPLIMAGIHQSGLAYTETLLPHMHLYSPQTHAQLMENFIYLCRHLSDKIKDEAKKMTTVLSRLKDMMNEADQYREDVLTIRTKLTKAQQLHSHLQHEVKTAQELYDQARQDRLLGEEQLAGLEGHKRRAEQQVDDAFQQVSPLYQAAVQAVRSLSQSDVNEVRHYRQPPGGVMPVMDAICLLFGCPSGWESSVQLMCQPNFFQELAVYDRSRVHGQLFEALQQMVERPELQPEAVRGVSRACESLCLWVHAVYQHACVQRHMAPQEAHRAQLRARLAECQTQLHLLQVQEESAHRLLRDSEKRLRAAEEEGEELKEWLHQSESWEQENAAAIRWLDPHIKAWRSAAERTEEAGKTAPGDALILAAAVTYLGPFGPDVRCELLEKWGELCCSGWISPTPEDPRRAPLSPPGPVPANAAGFVPMPVARDVLLPLSRAVGVAHGAHPSSKPCLLIKLLLWGHRVHCARHWPLLADVQQRNKLSSADKGWTVGFFMKDCSAWDGRGYDLVVDANDPTLLDKIRQSAEKGSSVLVTHVELARPSPELLRLLLRPSSRAPPLSSLPQTVHPEFHLVLSTPLPVQALQHEIHPSILAKVQVIDFSLGAAEVQDVLLMEMVQTKCPGLWKQRRLFLRDQQALLDKLQQEETSLLEHIRQSFSPVLQDLHFCPLVSTYQNAASGLQAELAEATLGVERHDAMLAAFHGAARLAADLYRALQEVARLCPLYRFPLCDFLQVVKEAIVLNEHLDANSGGQLPAATVMAAITDSLARRVLGHYQPHLLQDHVTLLWLLVSVSLCQHDEGSSEAERVAFLHGLATEPSPEANEPKALTSPCPTCEPSWIPLHTHSKVLCLEKLPPFAGLLSSLQAYPERWREYLRFPSSTVMGPVPFSAFSQLSTLQRALLWKTLLPHCLAAVADDLAACLLGQPAGASFTGAAPEMISTILDKAEDPIILMLPGQKGQPYTHPLRWLNQAAQCLPDKKVNIRVVTFGGKCHKEAVLAVLDEAVQKGHWLVFNNCHLLDQWDDDVVYRLTQLVSCTGQGNITGVKQEKNLSPSRDGSRLAQPGFRLWFICQAQVPFSIPVAVRMNATCLVCSSPRDLKGVLSYSLQQSASATWAASTSSEALLQCSILHSVLLQHQIYLGQGHHYSWTQEDLLALLGAEVQIAGRLADPAAVLEYIAAALVYGGQIADLVDLETVQSLARVCVRPSPSSQWDSGPLSELFKISGCSGLAEQLNGLLGQVHGLPHHSDPTLLGFTFRLDVELVKEQSHSLDLLLQQLPGPWDHLPRSRMEGDGPPGSDLQHVRARLLTLRDMLDRKRSQRPVATSAVFQRPLRHFLKQEMDRLMEVVSSLLAGLTHSPQNSAQASPTPTLLGLSCVEKQAELLSAYLQEESNCTYCLSAFINPHGFLAALVREGIRDKHGDISQVFLHFQVLSAVGLPDSAPDSGAYLCGLELQGAQWATQLGALQGTSSSKRCPFPILWVRPKSRAVKSSWSQDNPPPSVLSSLPLYHCPLYLEGVSADTGMSLEKNIIARVPLATELDPGLCAVRRVRLISSLRPSESYKLSQWH